MTVAEGRNLDWRPNPERVSPDYPMQRRLAPSPPRSYSWAYVQLDQGSQGACTIFSAMMEAAARPRPFFGDPVKAPPDKERLGAIAGGPLYLRVRQLDEWPGEDYEGSSVDAGCQVGREQGWWRGWSWAIGTPEQKAEQVCRAIAAEGPVMMGAWWRSDMWQADADGWLRYSGRREGGHAFLFTRYSRGRDAVWTPNSWNGAGQGWISRLDLTVMFGEDAEAALASQRQLSRG